MLFSLRAGPSLGTEYGFQAQASRCHLLPVTGKLPRQLNRAAVACESLGRESEVDMVFTRRSREATA